MNEDLILETKLSAGDIIFHLVLLGLFSFGGCFCLYIGFTKDEYPQLLPLFLGCFLCGFAVFFFFSSFRLKRYRLYEDRLEVISIAGNVIKTVWLDTITSWSETDARYGKILALYMGDDKCTINSNSIQADYGVLKEKLTSGKKEVSWEVNAVLQMLAYVVLLTGLCCFALSYNKYRVRNTEVHAPDVTTISGVILNPVAIYSTGGRSSRDYIKISLSSYPGFQFTIDYSAYRATKHSDYVADVQRGDSLYLDILTEDYQKKLTKEKQLTFLDKTVDYKKIDVYSLRSAHGSYLTEDGYNNAVKGDTRFIGYIIYGVFAFLFAIPIIVKLNNRKTG